MKKVKQLLDPANLEAETSTKLSQTEAGQASFNKPDVKQVDAINQVFTLFQINYHNQFYAAFGDSGAYETQAKRLWLESLRHFSPQQLLKAAKQVIEESEYLPTLQLMLSKCEEQLSDIGLPPVREAYLEASNAPSPKNAYSWSHPAIYFAGLETGWQRLATGSERETFPEFSKHYRELIRRVARGEELKIDKPEQLSHQPGKKLSREEQRQHLARLKQLMKN